MLLELDVSVQSLLALEELLSWGASQVEPLEGINGESLRQNVHTAFHLYELPYLVWAPSGGVSVSLIL